jgi:type II secretion system protein H
MKSGFTLIELLVVLVIVALVSGFVVPRIIAPFGQLQVKTAATELAGLLRYARSQAVSQKINRAVVFDLEARTISFFSPARPGADFEGSMMEGMPADTIYKPPAGVKVDLVSDGEKTAESGVFTLAFFPSGNSSGAELVVSGETGRQYGIRVDSITGMVALSRSEQEAR